MQYRLFKRSIPFPFKTGQPLIMACHFTGIYDVNRSNILPDDDFSQVEAWAASLQKQQVNGIIFHNNLSEATCSFYTNTLLHFERVKPDAAFNPNVYRYIIYREYLRLYSMEITSLFVTDVSDVVLINNPFTDPLFTANTHTLFCGDEPQILNNEWMIDHATHLRNAIADYATYEADFKQAVLLNCGIIGGNCLLMQKFIEQLAAIHEHYNSNNTTAYTGDMGAFNYVVRNRFNINVVHGYPVNTIFKGYELERQDCWFRHK